MPFEPRRVGRHPQYAMVSATAKLRWEACSHVSVQINVLVSGEHHPLVFCWVGVPKLRRLPIQGRCAVDKVISFLGAP